MAGIKSKLINIGILTNGGDMPGLNAAIKAITTYSLENDIARRVIGIKNGYEGLINVDTMALDEQIVAKWDREGGTNLGSSRTNPFDYKKTSDSDAKDVSYTIEDCCGRLELDAVIVLGGEGSLSVAAKLYAKGIPMIGIPKTIDKDVPETEVTLGFDSALEYNRKSINLLRNTASSHKIIYFYETMGRDSGFLALETQKASGCNIVLIPEYHAPIEALTSILQERRYHNDHDIVIISEGYPNLEGNKVYNKRGELGGVSEYYADLIYKNTNFATRNNIPAHQQRGAEPISRDIILGTEFGIAAVQLAKRKKFGTLVIQKNGKIGYTILTKVLNGVRQTVNVDKDYDIRNLTSKTGKLCYKLS